MQDYVKLAKKKISSYKVLIERLQRTASNAGLIHNSNVEAALNKLKKSFYVARKTAGILEGDNAPLWWMCLQTGEITNEHIEKLETDYMSAVSIIIEPTERKITMRNDFTESRISMNSHI